MTTSPDVLGQRPTAERNREIRRRAATAQGVLGIIRRAVSHSHNGA